MARITMRTRLACTPDQAADLVLSPHTMRTIAAPLAVMEPVDPPEWPSRWREGRHGVRLKILGLIPAGRQVIDIRLGDTHPDAPPDAFVLHDAGSGDLMKRWDHWIFAAPHPGGGTEYTDRVEVCAGALTPLAALMTRLFFVWRQHRLRALARQA